MNDNIIQILSLLMNEYGYKIKLSSKTSILKKDFDNIIDFFDYYNVQYRINNTVVELPCIACVSDQYYLMNKQSEIVDHNNKVIDTFNNSDSFQFISINKISKQQISLFTKKYFIKEKIKSILKNKINIFLFCLLAILLNVLIWILSFFVQYFIDELIGNKVTLMAIKYFIYIVILVIVFKYLYGTLRSISIKNNELFKLENIAPKRGGLYDFFHTFILLLLIMPFCTYVIYNINTPVAYILLCNCSIEILLIYIHKLCIENQFIKAIKILNIYSNFIYFITILPYLLLSIVFLTYDVISLGYIGMLSIIYFSLIYQFIIIDRNLEYLMDNYINTKKYFINMAINQAAININTNNILRIEKYKNLENIVLQPSKTYLFHGPRMSGKTYLAKLMCGLIRDPKIYIYLDEYKVINLDRSALDERIAYINSKYDQKEILSLGRKYVNKEIILLSDYFSLSFLELVNTNVDINKLLDLFSEESDTNQFLIIFSLLILQNKKIFLIDSVFSSFDNSIFNQVKEIGKKLNLLLVIFEQGNNFNRKFDNEFNLK